MARVSVEVLMDSVNGDADQVFFLPFPPDPVHHTVAPALQHQHYFLSHMAMHAGAATPLQLLVEALQGSQRGVQLGVDEPP